MEIKAVFRVSQLSSHWKRILNTSWQVRDKNIYCKTGTVGTDRQAWREVKYCPVLTSVFNLTGAKLGSNISSSSLLPSTALVPQANTFHRIVIPLFFFHGKEECVSNCIPMWSMTHLTGFPQRASRMAYSTLLLLRTDSAFHKGVRYVCERWWVRKSRDRHNQGNKSPFETQWGKQPDCNLLFLLQEEFGDKPI